MSYSGGGPRGPLGRGPPGGRGPLGRGGGRAGGEALPLEVGMQQMAAAMRGLALSNPAAPKWDVNVYNQVGVQRATRPNMGQAGRQITISANHFPMRLKATQAWHYDVELQSMAAGGAAPRRPPRAAGRPPPAFPAGLTRRVLWRLSLQEAWPEGWASDGRKNLYTITPFLAVEREHQFAVELEADDGGRSRTFKVVIKFAATVDFTALEAFIKGQGGVDVAPVALQVLDTVLRSGVSRKEAAHLIGKSVFFYRPQDPDMWMDLGRGLEAWAGYKQAVKRCQYGLSLNIDLAATAFYAAKPLHDLVAMMLGRRSAAELRPPLSPKDMRTIRQALRGLRVVVARGERGSFRKTNRSVSRTDCTNTEFFNDQEGREMNLVEYNQKAYNLTLQFPWLPPVNVESTSLNWQPMEICTVLPGQRKGMLDDPKVMSNMLKFACIRPQERRPYLQDVITNSELGGFNQDPTVKAFGIEVSTKMKDVQARVLKQPMLVYSQPACLDPGTKGAWSLENKKFADPKAIQSWAFVNFCRQAEVDIQGPTSMHAFIKDLIWKIGDTGMGQVTTPPIIHARPGPSILDLMKEAAAAAEKQYGQKAQLIVCMLPMAKSDERYKDVKIASDSHLGIPSQCFAAPKASVGRNVQFKDRAQYCANLCMKLNAKLGGVNDKLAGEARAVPVIGGRPFIVMGADVTHPTGFSETEPSIAAVVGSYDATMGRYSSRVMQQGHRQEIIAGLKDATKDIMRVFHSKTKGRKPEAILFYRDGVAEGQFKVVLAEEYAAIRQACQELEDGYCPPITFVVVQKRHGTRLFPDPVNQEKFNVLPGTTVDRVICHPTQFDFYLNSHAGLQGHNKTAHYHVLVDENGFSADGLQLLTYWMCYLYCRCTRSVSYVPPAYYAHLAAFRGRLMVEETDDSATDISARTPLSYHSINRDLIPVQYYV